MKHDIKLTPSEKEQSPMNTLVISSTPHADVVAAKNIAALRVIYIEDCRRNGARRRTLQNYAHQIEPFFVWWGEVSALRDHLLSRDALRDFPQWLRDHDAKLQPGTIYTYCKRTRQFLRWLYKSGRLSIDISQWLPIPSKPTPRHTLLTADEITRLMHAVRGGYRIRNLAIIAFLLETGCRRIEAANATWDNVQFVEQWRGFVFLEVTKGHLDKDTRRTVVFGEVAGRLLQLWRILSPPPPDDNRVFRITNSGIARMLTKLAQKTDIHFSAHDFRRAFTTHWVKHAETPNTDLAERLLELQLGHTPRGVTRQHYMVLSHSDVLEHYVSPFDDVDLPGLTGSSV